MEKGEQLLKDGKLKDAAINFKKAIQKDSTFGPAYYKLGQAELRQGNIGEGYRALTRAAELMPGDVPVRVELGELALAGYLSDTRRPQNLYNQIKSISAELLKKDANSVDGLRLTGYLAITDRKPEDALTALQKADAIKPLEPKTVLPLAQTLATLNRLPEAEKAVVAMLAKDKAFGPGYDFLYGIYIGTNRIKEGETLLREKVAANPGESAYRLQLALHLARAQNEPEMKRTLQPLLEDNKAFPNGPMQVGDFYRGLGNADEAQQYYQQGAVANPSKKADFEKRRADVLFQERKLDEAVRVLDEIIKADPKDQDAVARRAAIWLESGDKTKLDAVVRDFDTVVKAKPENVVARFSLGQAYRLKGDLNAARKEFIDALKRRTDFQPARLALVEVALQTRQYPDALRYSEEMLQANPNNGPARLLHGSALRETGKFEESRLELAKLVEQYPENQEAQLQLSMSSIAARKFQDAETILRKLHKPGSADLRPTLALAELYASQGQYDRTVQFLVGELAKAPNPDALRFTLAEAYARAGKPDLAKAQYQELLKKNPESPEVFWRLGELSLIQGKPDEAIPNLEKSASLQPKDVRPAIALANIYLEQNRGADAQRFFERAMVADPENPVVLNNYAFMLADSGGDLDKALRMAQKAQQRTPSNPDVSDTLGWIYLKRKNTDSAMQIFNSLVQKYPQRADFHYHLGAALFEKGDSRKARQALETALAQKPSKPDAEKIRSLMSRIS